MFLFMEAWKKVKEFLFCLILLLTLDHLVKAAAVFIS